MTLPEGWPTLEESNIGTAGIARMALQLANHWAAKGSVDAA